MLDNRYFPRPRFPRRLASLFKRLRTMLRRTLRK